MSLWLDWSCTHDYDSIVINKGQQIAGKRSLTLTKSGRDAKGTRLRVKIPMHGWPDQDGTLVHICSNLLNNWGKMTLSQPNFFFFFWSE